MKKGIALIELLIIIAIFIITLAITGTGIYFIVKYLFE